MRAQTVSDVATIQDESGNARLLFHLDAAPDVANFAIGRATLAFDISGEARDETLHLRIHPVTSIWRAGDVTWTSGWRIPGGDFDVSAVSLADVDLSRGATSVVFDLTNVMKGSLEQGHPNLGFLVTADPAEGVGLRAEDAQRFTGLAAGRLSLIFRKTPPKPRIVAQADSVTIR